MGFRENLLKKIQINQLSEQVRRSLKPADPPQKIDRAAMQNLLGMSVYTHRHERDLDLYCREPDASGKQDILVLDNELKLYRTSVADVVLRKSPTVKEMVSIRNAIKILNDKDVVVSSKVDTLEAFRRELIGTLDLSYTQADLDALGQDGREALKNNYADGLIEVLALFSELLGYATAPKPFQLRHFHVWGKVDTAPGGAVQMEPVLLYDQMHHRLKMILTPTSTFDKAAMQRLSQISKDEAKADLEGDAVLAELKNRVPIAN
ncbi:MAG: hypothetical protein M0036_14040 [Desulfobacteraceae bacterium]|nr:hypothetical protein [Desulfobacteraceae bacterium]